MTVQRILKYPADEAALRQKSERVTQIDDSIQTLVQDLIDTLAANPGAGLAAPQIGVHKRVFVVRFGQDDKERKARGKDLEPALVLINPEIVKSGQNETGFDGCLSIPDLYTWSTIRPAMLTLRGMLPDGKSIRRTVKGIDARLVHHELDHLEGILFLDRIEKLDDLYIAKQDETGKSYLVPYSNLAKKKPPQNVDINALKL